MAAGGAEQTAAHAILCPARDRCPATWGRQHTPDAAAPERWTVTASWYCLPETVEPATEYRPRRVYHAYCGTPPGVRCQRCGRAP